MPPDLPMCLCMHFNEYINFVNTACISLEATHTTPILSKIPHKNFLSSFTHTEYTFMDPFSIRPSIQEHKFGPSMTHRLQLHDR